MEGLEDVWFQYDVRFATVSTQHLAHPPTTACPTHRCHILNLIHAMIDALSQAIVRTTDLTGNGA